MATLTQETRTSRKYVETAKVFDVIREWANSNNCCDEVEQFLEQHYGFHLAARKRDWKNNGHWATQEDRLRPGPNWPEKITEGKILRAVDDAISRHGGNYHNLSGLRRNLRKAGIGQPLAEDKVELTLTYTVYGDVMDDLDHGWRNRTESEQIDIARLATANRRSDSTSFKYTPAPADPANAAS